MTSPTGLASAEPSRTTARSSPGSRYQPHEGTLTPMATDLVNLALPDVIRHRRAGVPCRSRQRPTPTRRGVRRSAVVDPATGQRTYERCLRRVHPGRPTPRPNPRCPAKRQRQPPLTTGPMSTAGLRQHDVAAQGEEGLAPVSVHQYRRQSRPPTQGPELSPQMVTSVNALACDVYRLLESISCRTCVQMRRVAHRQLP